MKICQFSELKLEKLIKNIVDHNSKLKHVYKVSVQEQLKMHNFILQELQISINKLGERVAPWLKIRLSGDPSMTQIISAVDKIVYDDGIIREKVMQTSLRGLDPCLWSFSQSTAKMIDDLNSKIMKIYTCMYV